MEDVYAQALQQSAATVTTAPANAGFQPPRGQPVQQFATAVPPIVQQSYNASLTVRPPALPSSGTPVASGPGRTAFAAAGARLASTILFADGSASLAAADRAALRNVAADYKGRGGAVRVIGYASSGVGTQSSQQKLATFDMAERRAQAVANELVRLGVKPGAVFVEAMTDAGPGYVAAGSLAAEDSRRAEIFLEN